MTTASRAGDAEKSPAIISMYAVGDRVGLREVALDTSSRDSSPLLCSTPTGEGLCIAVVLGDVTGAGPGAGANSAVSLGACAAGATNEASAGGLKNVPPSSSAGIGLGALSSHDLKGEAVGK